jgi:hypothetical protein
MQDTDLRLIKQVRLADEERQRRIQAERVASALKAANLRLLERLRSLTLDRAPSPPKTDLPS